jgi:hypothetical protein
LHNDQSEFVPALQQTLFVSRASARKFNGTLVAPPYDNQSRETARLSEESRPISKIVETLGSFCAATQRLGAKRVVRDKVMGRIQRLETSRPDELDNLKG